MKTIVLGAGIVGTATAYFLAKQGHEVEVVERRSGAALETSFGNGGVIHASEVEPWSQPGMPRKILEWLGKENAPLLVRYGAIPHMWRWGLSFIANCTPERFRRNSLTNLRLALHSLKTLQGIRAETGIDYDLRTVGRAEDLYQPRILRRRPARRRIPVGPGPDLRARGSRGMRQARAGLAGHLRPPWSAASISPATRSAIAISSPPRWRPAAPGSASNSTTERRSWGWSAARTGIGAVRTSAGPMAADNFVAALASFTPGVLRSVGVEGPDLSGEGRHHHGARRCLAGPSADADHRRRAAVRLRAARRSHARLGLGGGRRLSTRRRARHAARRSSTMSSASSRISPNASIRRRRSNGPESGR